MPEETQPRLPGDGFPDGPGHPASSASVPVPGAPTHRASLTSALFTPTPRTPGALTPSQAFGPDFVRELDGTEVHNLSE